LEAFVIFDKSGFEVFHCIFAELEEGIVGADRVEHVERIAFGYTLFYHLFLHNLG
jgi:hypothetical protein